MINAAKLALAMLSIIRAEFPQVDDDHHEEYREHIELLAETNVREGSLGLLVSEELDPIILAAVQYGESRFRIWPKAGQAVGPMQLDRAAYLWDWKEIAPWDPWLKVTKGSLTAYDANVMLGYYVLNYRQERCNATNDLYRLFAVYRLRECPKRGVKIRDFHANQRCEVARELAVTSGVHWPETLSCGKTR